MFVLQLDDSAVRRVPVIVDPDTTVGELVAWFRADPGLSAGTALKWAGLVVRAVLLQDGAALAGLDEAGYTLSPVGS